jgi:hypothetical protein
VKSSKHTNDVECYSYNLTIHGESVEEEKYEKKTKFLDVNEARTQNEIIYIFQSV